MELKPVLGNITKLEVDVIVNAANTSLLGGSGVDGAIHRAAGPELALECLKLGGCKPGQAKLTSAYNLPCKAIIHTVGPYWLGGMHGEEDILRSCYLEALKIANARDYANIAFPCISTGIYKFPADLACKVAIEACRAADKGSIQTVTFCCFQQADLDLYKQALGLKMP